MNEAERRKANRMRVATGVTDEYVPPGLTGSEIMAIGKQGRGVSGSSANRGKTMVEGGWRAPEQELDFGAAGGDS